MSQEADDCRKIASIDIHVSFYSLLYFKLVEINAGISFFLLSPHPELHLFIFP